MTNMADVDDAALIILDFLLVRVGKEVFGEVDAEPWVVSVKA